MRLLLTATVVTALLAQNDAMPAANAAAGVDAPLAPLARLARQQEIIDDASKIIRDRLAVVLRQRETFAQAATLAVLAPAAGRGVTAKPSVGAARRRGFAAFVLGRYQRDISMQRAEATRMAIADRAAAQRLTELQAALATPLTKLRWPTNGAVLVEFGTRHDAARRLTLAQRGMRLAVGDDARTPKAVAGADISAPGDGTVAYAGPLQGLGLVVVLDHGAMMTVVGGLTSAHVRTGEYIARGAPIGRAVGSIYLELRLGARLGMPVNPRPYFAEFPSK
ncbi:MAG: peptidoglycan DD-metalloendopeptidase family protein [Myxococcales bacterium]|nr:peptidoglycan DD-metalloendopeptidase family protein [Myxococcales bacterium]